MTVPGFVLIPKVKRVANPRVERLGARDERIVFDVLLVETDVRLGYFGNFDVGTRKLFPKEFDLFLNGGCRTLDVHFGDGWRNTTACHGHG